MALIETFLLDKLEDAIEKAKSSPNSSRYLSRLKIDEELKNSIGKTIGSAIVKEKLYSLNNEVLLLRNLDSLNIKTRLYINRFVENLNKTLTEIKRELQSVESAGEKPTDSIYRWSTRLADPTTKIPGFEDRSMERLLVANGLKSIGIIGMAGVGKTTLCQVSFNNPKVKSYFFPRIWVCMSRQPKDDADFEKEVARRMLACLGFEDKVVDILEGRVKYAVRQQLKGKRYLTVLDDVDEESSYKLPEWYEGTVIVTSRSRQVAEVIVGEKMLYELLPVMDKESCWVIFTGAAAEKDGNGPEVDLTEMKDKIVESCGGLPLVAKMMRQIVQEKKQNKREKSLLEKV